MVKKYRTPLRTSRQDIDAAQRIKRTPQTEADAYKLAFSDEEFLTSEALRGVRFQLEYLKPELMLQERGILSTVVLFGGARIPAPGKEAKLGKNDLARKNLQKISHYYDEARLFAQYASLASKKFEHKEYVVVTGGGPGIMEAGNLGAKEVDAPSIAFNIVLPHEQAPNLHVTPELCFNFHYFATRKIHFLLRAKAVAIFPGGFGTLDEFFETMTLIQTGRMEKIPLLMFGKEFWDKAINIKALEEAGTVSPNDSDLITIVDSAKEGWEVVRKFYDLGEVSLE
jgi:hypothetical protein